LLVSSWSAAQHGEPEPDTFLPFAISLLEFEMGEVAAHVLGQLATAELSKEAMSFCLELGLQAILGHAEVGEIDAAERAFSELAPLLEVLKAPKFAHVGPGPAALSRVLAESELEAGRLDQALPRLEAAAETAPTAEGWIRLASLKLKLDKPEASLAALDQAVRLAQARGDLFAESVAETNAYKVLVRMGNREPARVRLGNALQRLLTLRSLDVGILSRAALERQLATILEYYGQHDAVERAYSRALLQSRASPAELRQTLIDTARSALVGKNLRMARDATHYALELGVESADAIYIALWQSLLEQELSVESNGMPLQVFESAKDATGWALHLRQWGLGRLSPGELMRNAKRPSERAEADFYDGMRASGEARKAALARVVNVPTLSLIEAGIADTLLRPGAPEPLPQGTVLP
jgi:tetratricopeptide (TPR) repeat protein